MAPADSIAVLHPPPKPPVTIVDAATDRAAAVVRICGYRSGEREGRFSGRVANTGTRQSTSALAAMTFEYHVADAFGVRCWVPKSTRTRP